MTKLLAKPKALLRLASAMHTLFGTLMALIGAFFLVSATIRSDFVLYRLLAARSRILWGARVHVFYQVVGAILATLGAMWALGVIWNPS